MGLPFYNMIVGPVYKKSLCAKDINAVYIGFKSKSRQAFAAASLVSGFHSAAVQLILYY